MRQPFSDGRSGAHGESRQQTLREWMDTQVVEFGPLPRPPRRKQSKIRHFKRIVFCDEQWPDIAMQFDRYTELMAGLFRPQEDTIFRVPSVEAGLRQFLRAGLRANDRNTTLDPSTEILTLIRDYIQQSQQVQGPFRESILRARCLLWALEEVWTLQHDCLSSCHAFLSLAMKRVFMMRISNFTWTFQGSFQCLGVSPLNMLAAPLIQTVFYVTRYFLDAQQWRHVDFGECFRLLIIDTQRLALEYHVSGALDAYFQQEGSRQVQLSRGSQAWMTSILRTRGKTLNEIPETLF